MSAACTACAMLAGFTACSDNEDIPVAKTIVSVTLETEGEAPVYANPQYTFKNLANGETYTFDNPDSIQVVSGLYDIEFAASGTLSGGITSQYRAVATSVTLTGQQSAVTLKPFVVTANNDFIITEVFFACTAQPSGKAYIGDDYIKIYNNTDHVLYADGLTIFESKFNTSSKQDYTPNIMSDAVTVQALYTIPGNGTEHPVQPGQFLLIADNGLDHRTNNPNSFSLAHADFEWYDVSSSASAQDVDSPSVPNLDKVYCYTATYWILTTQGNRAFGLCRIPPSVDRNKFLTDNLYNYTYPLVTASGSYQGSGKGYSIPNSWVVDVVNCSPRAVYQWNVTDPSLDSGFAYVAHQTSDKSRYFKAVRRKVVGFSAAGNPVFSDTNNSSVDFNHGVTASEIELQGTVMDTEGNKATVITYDGVTPRR